MKLLMWMEIRKQLPVQIGNKETVYGEGRN